MRQRSTSKEIRKRRGRVAYLLVHGVTDPDQIADDLVKKGLLARPQNEDRLSYAATMRLISRDIHDVQGQVDEMFVSFGEYEAAREELIFWMTSIRDEAAKVKAFDSAIKASLILSRAKGFDVATAEIRKAHESPTADRIPDSEREFVKNLSPEQQRRWLAAVEGRLPRQLNPAIIDAESSECAEN